MPYYLGLDSSTQSLTAIVVDSGQRRVLFQDSLAFDSALPHYGTDHGVLPRRAPAEALSSPLMWTEALDVMMARLVASGVDLSRLAAISGSAQQHGSVYLNAGQRAPCAPSIPARPLVDQVDAAAVAAGLADLDGLQHAARVRGDHRGRRRRGHPQPAHRLAGVRALHRPADPQVLQAGPAQPTPRPIASTWSARSSPRC